MEHFKTIYFFLLSILFFFKTSYSQWQFETQIVPQSSLSYISTIDTGTSWTNGQINYNSDTPFVAVRNVHQNMYWNVLYYWDMDLPLGIYDCIAGITDSIALIGTQTGKVYMTTNQGINWVLKIDAGGQSFVDAIKFSKQNKKYGYVFCDPPTGSGDDFKFYKTSDYGFNWSAMSPNFGLGYIGLLNSAWVTDSVHAWFGLYCFDNGCSRANMAITTNGGLNWNTTSFLPDFYTFTFIVFKNDNLNGITSDWGGTGVYLYNSINGGNNWQAYYILPSPINQPLNALVWVPETTVWYFSTRSMAPYLSYFYKSTNDGGDWNLMTRDNSSDGIQMCRCYKI